MSDRVGCRRRSWSAYSGTDRHFPCRTLLCMPSASPRPLSPPRGAMHKTPRAHEITDRLSFSLTSLSNLRFFDFVVVFFLLVGFKSGTIRNALAAATSAHTDHRARRCVGKGVKEKAHLGIAPHQQAHARASKQALLHRSTAQVILKMKTPAPPQRRSSWPPEDLLLPASFFVAVLGPHRAVYGSATPGHDHLSTSAGL